MNTQQINGSDKNNGSQLDARVAVYVVAWMDRGQVEFNIYHSPSAAERVFAIEKEYCNELTNREMGRKSICVEVHVTSLATAEREVDEQIEALFEKAQNRYTARRHEVRAFAMLH
jgi:inosine-uridine nucleoside N-ribohydrolase